MKSYIRCTDVDYESARTESFLDIQVRDLRGAMPARVLDAC